MNFCGFTRLNNGMIRFAFEADGVAVSLALPEEDFDELRRKMDEFQS